MDLAQARALMEEHISDPRLRKHCLAASAVLAALARRLGEDEQTWAVAGMLHDLDYDQTAQDMARHGLVTAQILAQHDLPPEVIQAIKAHNAENLGLERIGVPIERGFIKAEVVGYEDFISSGGEIHSVKEKGLLRLEGKDYIVEDGDIMHVRFNV